MPLFRFHAWLTPIPLLAACLVAPAQNATPATTELDLGLLPARTAFSEGRWAEAERQTRQYLQGHGESAAALYLLASTLFYENKPRESLETFTHAARIIAPTALDLRIVAMDYVLLNDYTDANKWITVSLQKNPQDGESWYALGRIRQTENRFADAVAAFNKALEWMPKSVKTENNLGLAFEGLNQPERAIDAYRQAIEWQQNAQHPSAQPLINLGILLTDRNQSQEALALLQKAEALPDTDPRVHGALARLYSHLNRFPEAQRELGTAIKANPADGSLHFQLGQVYRKEGLKEQSAAELKRAAELEAVTRR
jgi:tetratricopeptide (TPR) repeat protein